MKWLCLFSDSYLQACSVETIPISFSVPPLASLQLVLAHHDQIHRTWGVGGVWCALCSPSPSSSRYLLLQGIGGRNWRGRGGIFKVPLQLNPYADFPRGPVLGNLLSVELHDECSLPQVPIGTPQLPPPAAHATASCSLNIFF